jgi:hypothetical protein
LTPGATDADPHAAAAPVSRWGLVQSRKGGVAHGASARLLVGSGQVPRLCFLSLEPCLDCVSHVPDSPVKFLAQPCTLVVFGVPMPRHQRTDHLSQPLFSSHFRLAPRRRPQYLIERRLARHSRAGAEDMQARGKGEIADSLGRCVPLGRGMPDGKRRYVGSSP